MKEGKDGDGLRKENSVHVKTLSSYKLFTLIMHCEVNQQTHISELLLISAHFILLKSFFSQGLTHSSNAKTYTCYCLTNSTVYVRHKIEVFKMCKDFHFFCENHTKQTKSSLTKAYFLMLQQVSIYN